MKSKLSREPRQRDARLFERLRKFVGEFRGALQLRSIHAVVHHRWPSIDPYWKPVGKIPCCREEVNLRRRHLAIFVVFVTLVTSACGGGTTAKPTPADKKACIAALYRLDLQVWILHQPVDAHLDPAAAACYWVSRSRLRAATMAGQAGYQERIRRLFGS